MGSFDNLVGVRAKTYWFKGIVNAIYRVISNFWCIDNGESIYKNKDCYKILTFDEEDDVIDLYASLHH